MAPANKNTAILIVMLLLDLTAKVFLTLLIRCVSFAAHVNRVLQILFCGHTMIEIRKSDATLKKLLPTVKMRLDIKFTPFQCVLPFAHKGEQYAFHNTTKQSIEDNTARIGQSGRRL